MNPESMETPALACVPDAIPAAERPAHFALIRRLFGEVVEARVELEDGAAFRFPPGALAEVARFLEGERRCCPFLTFTLEVPAGQGPISLSIRGPAGTRELLAAELSI